MRNAMQWKMENNHMVEITADEIRMKCLKNKHFFTP